MNPKGILITGSDGMLGSAFRSECGQQAIALSKRDCDVTDRDAVLRLERYGPEVIVHCAANVNADACERDIESCRNTQVGGTQNIIDLANACGAKILYPQTFLIFDGHENPIIEETPPSPLSWYGQCKLDAARAIEQQCQDYLIVQMGGFFGGGPIDKNFVGKFVPHLIGLVKEGKKSIDVGDRVWQPTYTYDIAKNCLALLQENKSGIFNMAAHGSTTFHGLASECAKLLNLDDKIAIVPVSAEAVQKTEAALRPSIATMENRRLRAEGLDQQRSWSAALKDYLDDDYFRNMVTDIDFA